MIIRQTYDSDTADTLLETAMCAASDDENTVRDSVSRAVPENIEKTLNAVIEYSSILEQARNSPTNWGEYNGPIK